MGSFLLGICWTKSSFTVSILSFVYTLSQEVELINISPDDTEKEGDGERVRVTNKNNWPKSEVSTNKKMMKIEQVNHLIQIILGGQLIKKNNFCFLASAFCLHENINYRRGTFSFLSPRQTLEQNENLYFPAFVRESSFFLCCWHTWVKVVGKYFSLFFTSDCVWLMFTHFGERTFSHSRRFTLFQSKQNSGQNQTFLLFYSSVRLEKWSISVLDGSSDQEQ